jgi:hypothetical protein
MQTDLKSSGVLTAIAAEATPKGIASTDTAVALAATTHKRACDLHKTNSHSNAQCIEQGGPSPASYVPKVRTGRPNLPVAASAVAQVARISHDDGHDSDASAFATA